MTEVEAFRTVLEYVALDSVNLEMISFFRECIERLKGSVITQETDPRHTSRLRFSYNIFPFTNQEYILMAETIRGENNG